MKQIVSLFAVILLLLTVNAQSEWLEVETIKKAEVIIIGFIKSNSTIELSILVKSPVDVPPVCKIVATHISPEALAKWCKDHNNEKTIFFATVNKDSMDLTPQFGPYSFWPQGHNKGHWIDQPGYPPIELSGAVIIQASKGENFMKKSYRLYKPSTTPNK